MDLLTEELKSSMDKMVKDYVDYEGRKKHFKQDMLNFALEFHRTYKGL